MRNKIQLLILLLAVIPSNWGVAGIPVRGFINAGFEAQEASPSSNNFYHGGIDFFYTKKIDSNLNALAEVVFEMGEDNGAILDPERLWIQYSKYDLLNIKVGRVHTALGYWNQNFHHGTYLQTTIHRPMVYEFEDDGGFLPIHSSGLELSGSTSIGTGDFNYVFNIVNGRGPEPDPPQIINDADESKAVNLLVYYKTAKGIRFGATAYLDTLPGGTKTVREAAPSGIVMESTSILQKGKESIFGFHLIYEGQRVEIINEVLRLEHKFKDKTVSEGEIIGAYSQWSYVICEVWKAYVRYDHLDVVAADAYTGLSEDMWSLTVGSRMELTTSSAIKFEYTHKESEFSAPGNRWGIDWSLSW